MTKRTLPDNAIMIPEQAGCVFHGEIFDVYQWQQEMFDGSYERFEMLRRPDVGMADLATVQKTNARWCPKLSDFSSLDELMEYVKGLNED